MSTHYSIDSLREISGDDEDFMKVVAQTFLEEIPPDLDAMLSAIENENKELAYQFAHKMKPNLEMFGIDLLKQIKAIESWTDNSKNKNTISHTVDEVKETLEKVFQELQTDFNL